jgi:hypothetical protein
VSDLARFWARNLKGLNMAEHAICRELGEFHVEDTGLCYPNIHTLCGIYECSRDYLKKVLNRLENWKLVERKETFDPNDKNRQTSNRYKLNLRRHCPDPAAEGRKTKDKNPNQTARPYDKRDFQAIDSAKKGRELMRVMNFRAIDLGEHFMVSSVNEAYLMEKILWVWVDNEVAMKKFLELLPELAELARKQSRLEFTVSPVSLYFKNKKR